MQKKSSDTVDQCAALGDLSAHFAQPNFPRDRDIYRKNFVADGVMHRAFKLEGLDLLSLSRFVRNFDNMQKISVRPVHGRFEVTYELNGRQQSCVLPESNPGEFVAKFRRQLLALRYRFRHEIAMALMGADFEAKDNGDTGKLLPVKGFVDDLNATVDNFGLYIDFERFAGVEWAEFLGSREENIRITILVARILAQFQEDANLKFIHHDVKPANILVRKAGEQLEVRLIDFGSAESCYRDLLPDGYQLHSGTPTHSAPEQINDKSVYVRGSVEADVYGLAVSLYQKLRRQNLFGQDPREKYNEPLIAAKLRILRLPDLEQLLGKALSVDPADRPSMREFADRLQGILDGVS